MTLAVEVGSGDAANNVVSLIEAKPMVPTTPDKRKADDVLIHVRFHPNGLVNTIDSRPEHLSPQDWFYDLRYAAPLNYQVFAGGRGFFRIQRSYFENILSQHAA